MIQKRKRESLTGSKKLKGDEREIKEIKDGMDLGLEGYNAVSLDGKVIYGQAWVNVNKDNMADYPF